MGCVCDVIYGFDRRLKFYNCLVFLTSTDGRRVEIPASPGAVDPVLAHEAVATVTGEPAHNKTRCHKSKTKKEMFRTSLKM